MEFLYYVPDYEHRGDLDHAVSEIKHICPECAILKASEERDSEAETDYKREYGELDEPIYMGYVEFEAPESYKEKLLNYGCYCN